MSNIIQNRLAVVNGHLPVQAMARRRPNRQQSAARKRPAPRQDPLDSRQQDPLARGKVVAAPLPGRDGSSGSVSFRGPKTPTGGSSPQRYIPDFEKFAPQDAASVAFDPLAVKQPLIFKDQLALISKVHAVDLGLMNEDQVDRTSVDDVNVKVSVSLDSITAERFLAMDRNSRALLIENLSGQTNKTYRYRPSLLRQDWFNSKTDAGTLLLLEFAQSGEDVALAHAFVAGHSAYFAIPDENTDGIGGTLLEHLKGRGELTPSAVASIFEAVAEEVALPAGQSVVANKASLLDSAGTSAAHNLCQGSWQWSEFEERMGDIRDVVVQVSAGDEMQQASRLAILGGLVLASAFKAAEEIKGSIEQEKKLIDCAKSIFFGLVGYGHPIAAIPVGIISPLVGLIIDHFVKVLDHSKMISRIQAHQEMLMLGAEGKDSSPGTWSRKAQQAFFQWLPTVLHANGLR